jgi:hypothetical protein
MTDNTNEVFETPDLNLATFLKVAKGYDTCGHRFKGDQLIIQFRISKEIGQAAREAYLNSQFSIYDATKRNFLQLLKR